MFLFSTLISALVLWWIFSLIDNRDKKLPHFEEWFNYYRRHGYTEEDATNYAIIQARKNLSLGEVLAKSQQAEDPAKAQAENRRIQTEREERRKHDGLMTILVVACFSIIIGLLVMANVINSDFVAPLFILIVITLFISGLCIHQFVDYLKPVGKCFIISSLVLAPFCYASFYSISHSEQMSSIINAIFTLVLYIPSAVLLDNKIVGILCYLFFAVLMRSLSSVALFEKGGDYFLSLIPFITIGLGNYIDLKKPSFVPKCFYSGAEFLRKYGVQFMSFWLIIFFFYISPDSFLLRTIFCAISLAFILAQYLIRRGNRELCYLRFYIQALIVMLLFDVFDFSLISTLANYQHAVFIYNFAFWIYLVSCAIQIALSLSLKHKKAEDTRNENILIGVELALMLSSSLIAILLSNNFLVLIAILAAAIFSFATAYSNSDLRWCLPAFAMLFLAESPLAQIFDTTSVGFSLFYQCLIALLAIAGFAYFKLIKKAKNTEVSFYPAVFYVCFTGMFYSYSLTDKWGLSLILPSVCTLALSLISKDRKILRELSIYVTSLCFTMLIGDIILALAGCSSVSTLRYCDPETLDMKKYIQAHMVGLSLAVTSLLYERSEDNEKAQKRTRLMLGYTLFSIIAGAVALFARYDQSNIAFGLIFLIEQIGLLFFAHHFDMPGLLKASAIVSILTLFVITDIFQNIFVWMIIIGVALIAFVVWKLNEKHKNETNGGGA